MAKVKEFKANVNVGGRVDPTFEKMQKNATGAIKKIHVAAAAAAVATVKMIGGFKKASQAIFDLGNSFQEAHNTLRIGTGATGAELQALNDDFKSLYQSVPIDIGAAANAISDINTRLGLTGGTLQKVARQTYYLENKLGAGTNVIENASAALQAFNVNSGNYSESLDYAFRVTQNTGIAWGEMTSRMTSYSAVFQGLGYDFKTTAALLGSFKKAGVDLGNGIGALQKILERTNKTGRSGAEEWARLYERIKNAKTETEAFRIAVREFGGKDGQVLARAIRNGTFAVAQLRDSLSAGGDTIEGLSTQTRTWREELQLMKNRISIALQPAAEGLVKMLTERLPEITGLLESVLPVLANISIGFIEIALKAAQFAGDISKYFAIAKGAITEFWDNWGFLVTGAAATLAILTGPAIIAGIKALTLAFAANALATAKAALGFLKLTAAMLANPFTWIAVAIGAVVAGVYLMIKHWDEVKVWLQNAWDWVKRLPDRMRGIVDKVRDYLTENFGLVGEYLANVISFFTEMAAGALQYFTGDFLDGIKMVWEGIKQLFSGDADGLLTIFKGLMNTIIGWVNVIIGAINTIQFTAPEWIPKVGGMTIGFDLPEIPKLWKGGFTTGPSLAGERGTELVTSFNPAYRKQNIDHWLKAGDMLGVGDRINNSNSNSTINLTFSPQITVTGGADAAGLKQQILAMGPEFADLVLEAIGKNQKGVYSA